MPSNECLKTHLFYDFLASLDAMHLPISKTFYKVERSAGMPPFPLPVARPPRSQETGKVQDKLFAGCWREGLESQLRLKCNLHNNELLLRLEALDVGYFSFRDIICGILLIPQ